MDMPFIMVKMMKGRDQEQKRQLVKTITDAMVDICDANPDGTMVVIEEVEKDHWSRGGVLISDRVDTEVK